MPLHPRQFWQNAFDAARAADTALTEAADWEVIKLTVPLPVPVERTCRRDGVTCTARR